MEATPVAGQVGASGSVESVTVDIAALFEGFTPQAGGEGYTSTELAKLADMSVECVRKRIRHALDEGVCRVSKKRVRGIDGRTLQVSSYVFQEAKG